jgi:hypothetical protein
MRLSVKATDNVFVADNRTHSQHLGVPGTVHGTIRKRSR